jgi:hypothetical protein
MRKTRPPGARHDGTKDQKSKKRDRDTCESQKEKNTASYVLSGCHVNRSAAR